MIAPHIDWLPFATSFPRASPHGYRQSGRLADAHAFSSRPTVTGVLVSGTNVAYDLVKCLPYLSLSGSLRWKCSASVPVVSLLRSMSIG